jgi:choline-glycine betaine transporter
VVTSRTPSLLPREHGAYAQVIFPLLTALALGGITVSALLLVIATVTVFLAHEPVLVLLGNRGGRAKRETSAPAGRRLAWLVVVGLAAGLVGLWLAPSAARVAALWAPCSHR